MNAIADKFAPLDVGSAFVYTHEAHPGENVPHLTSLEQKFRHARLLRDEIGVTRPIVVDALDGACHRAYGSMPNMTWIFARSGLILYKSDWTDAHSVENAIEYFAQIPARRKTGERLAGFRVERFDYRNQEREQFYQRLERNGQKALEEFKKAFPNG
ncbi:MAG: hypothetical protein Fur0035_25370 [Anaerolineales bacterium]